MKYFFLTFSLALMLPPWGSAQEFEKAPLPKVRKITEWIQESGIKNVKKGRTYFFDKKGSLTKYEMKGTRDSPGESGVLKYDQQGRLVAKDIQAGYHLTSTLLAYTSKYHVEEVKYKDSSYKTFFYQGNNRKLIEKKTFISNYDSNYKYQLFERVIYTHDKAGKLLGEKEYSYWHMKKGSTKNSVKKTKYEYYPKTKLVKTKKEYDYNDRLNFVTHYKYDAQGNLTKQVLDYLNGKKEATTYRYKNGKLWTEEYVEANITVTKIYKNDRLIRKRSKWIGGATEIIDFQYEFY